MNIRDWFTKAREEHFAIGSFNAGNLEVFRAICEQAGEMQSPVLIETSPGETKFLGPDVIVALAKTYSKMFSIPVFLNLDHAEEVDDCLLAIEAGYDLIHFDGSHGEYDENVKNTKAVVEAVRKADRGLIVEGEIDRLPTKSSKVYTEQIPQDIIEASYSDPEKIRTFVAETKIDTVATVFGNVHGLLPEQPKLDLELLKRIRDVNPDVFLSMHGSSGIPDDQVSEAIPIGGIVKINLNTELRKAFREALEAELLENKELAPYKFMPPTIEAVKAVVKNKIVSYGSGRKV